MVFVLEEEEAPEGFQIEPKESILKTIGRHAKTIDRHAARSGARAAEAILGTPGDIFGTIESGLGGGAKLLGMPEEKVEKALKIARFLSPMGRLPTSTELKEQVTEPLTGEFLKPRGKAEEFADEIVGDAAAMILSRGRPIKSKRYLKGILGSFGVSAGANTASEAAGLAGAGEKTQMAVKVGSMLVLGSLGKGKPERYVNKLYKEANDTIKHNPSVDATGLVKSVTRLYHELSEGLGAPSEIAVMTKIEKLLAKVKNGKITVKELMASKRSLSEDMSKVIFESADRAAKSRARKLFKKVSSDIRQEIDAYGKKNPKFGKAYKDAEEGFGALAQSQKVGNFIHKNAKYSPASVLLYPLVGALGKATFPALAASAGLYKTAQIGYRLYKSSALRTHYKNVLKYAAQENAPAMNRSLKKLDEALIKEDKKKPSKGRFVLED